MPIHSSRVFSQEVLDECTSDDLLLSGESAYSMLEVQLQRRLVEQRDERCVSYHWRTDVRMLENGESVRISTEFSKRVERYVAR
jgi:hypothetical protein